MTSEILTDEQIKLFEQIKSFEETFDKIAEVFKNIMRAVISVVHEIIEWLTEEKPVFKRVKKGSRYVPKVVGRRSLFALLVRRC